MDSLYISCLGPPQISLNNQQIDFKRRKAVALLVYLAMEGRSQSREFLSGLFWPEYEQSRAYSYLRRTIWEIKNVVGDGWLDVRREWVSISNSAEFQTDFKQFHSLLQGVKNHDHPFTEPCEFCIAQLESAIDMYRGDFLSGFSLSDCPQFDDWQFLQSEVIRRSFQDNLQNLVNALEMHGRISEAIPYTQRWLAIDNLDEAAHRKLMVLFAQNGQMHAALRQFELCQVVLRTELNLAPELTTTNLYNQIREHRFSPSGVNPAGKPILLAEGKQSSWLDQILSTPARVALQSNLPVQTTPFIGREAEIKEISGFINNPDCWLLTLTGMGGIGKTRLANQVGREIGENFPDGVFFIPLEGLETISALLPKIVERLALTFHPQDGPLEIQLNSFFQDKRFLIILDNFDSLISEAAILLKLHTTAASIKFLVTSRERLKISGEWVFEIQGLDFPKSDIEKLEESLNFHAVELFNHAARRTLNNFQIDEKNYRDISAITQIVEGIPLALEMAASWINLLSPEEILAEIQTDSNFLKSKMQDTPIRQRSMRAILDYSWKRLDQEEQSALAKLSVFQGGFSREAAEKVTGVSLAELKKFMDLSIIRQQDSGGLQIHELLRQYALEKLCASSENFKNTRERHAVYYCAALNSWGDGLKSPAQVELFPAMRREIENIQAAWTWVTQEVQIQQITGGIEGLCYFYLRSLRNQEGLEACQLGLSALEQAKADPRPEIHANLLAWKSIFCLNLDDHQAAVKAIDSSLEMIRDLEGKRNDLAPLRARLFTIKAIVETYLGNRESAIKFFDQAIEIYRQTEDYSGFSYLMLRALDTSGVTSEKTIMLLSEAIKFNRKSGDFFNTAYLLYMYCMVVAYHFGQPVQAAALMQEGSDIFEKLGDPLSKEMALAIADPILSTNGRYEELLEVREKKLAYALERGDRQAAGIYQAEVGETLCHLGNYPAAGDRFRKALVNIQSGIPYQYAFRLCCYGELLLVQDKISESYELFKESLKGMKIGEKWGQGRALAGLSIAAFMLGDREKAWEIVQQALGYHHEAHTHYFTHFSLGAYAYIISQNGDSLTGLKIYAILEQQLFVRDSRWFIDLYRNPIYALAMKNNLNEISTCESVGRQMNLWRSLEQIVQELTM
jgi:predicted ATPase/DNA-binding SARP family transcriptional activator